MSFLYWNKNDSKPLSKHFGTKEFTCQCTYDTCTQQLVTQELVDRLEKLRVELNQPIKINSGFRCSRHQADLRESGIKTAAGKSTHELGEAADIKCPIPVDDLVKAAEKYFDAIGIASTWIHVDLRGPQKRRWKY